MLELLQKIYTLLSSDSTLIGMVPVANILTGPVDITMEKQSDLIYPQINIRIVSEVQRSNPLNARDTQVQLDIWSRDSQLATEQIYERVIDLLSYQTTDQNTAHVFWTRLNGAVDLYESDRRIWHKAVTFSAWTIKPN